jgi:glycosyltransferase involved in cell wall biosynthesis
MTDYSMLKYVQMKLFFDARYTRTDYYDGISRYGSSLIEALHAAGENVTMLICDEKQLSLLPKTVPYVLINSPLSPQELFVARTLNRLDADVVFSPMQWMGSIGRRYKLILTLQDITYYQFPKPPTFLALPVRIIWRLFHLAYWPQRLLLKSADAVVTVSKTSRDYIVDYGLTKVPPTVIYNAPQAQTVPALKTPKKDIVYIGSFMPYKNAEVLIEGMAYAPSGFTLHLVSKIAPERRVELEALVPEKANIVFHNGLSESDYQQLLSGAFAVATGSRAEGFGLPIVEAATLGIPALLSNLPIFNEVAGKGALYFDPDDPQSFAARLDAMNRGNTRAELSASAASHVTRFTWAKSAKVLADLAKSLL